MNKDFKVGDKKWWTTYNVFCEIVDIKYDENSKPFEWIVDTKGLKGIRFDLFRIEELHQTADDMFEALGYEPTMASNNMVTYEFDDGGYIKEIEFLKYPIPHIRLKEYEEYNDNNPQGQFSCYIDLHQAIHQKMIELGWIE